MNIMIVSRGIPTEKYPLNGIFEFDQAKALAKAGINVTFLAVDLRSIRRVRHWGIRHGSKEGVDWYEINIPIGRMPLNIRNWIGACALNYLYKMIYKNTSNPDIIHAHFAEFGYIAAKISRKYNIPLVVTEHSSQMNATKISERYRKCAKIAYYAANVCIAVSRRLAQKIYVNTGCKSIVIHNIVDLDEFSKSEFKKHEGIRFVAVGSLTDNKRHSLLIDAFQMIHSKYSDSYLDIFGDGPLKNSLLEKIKKMNLSENVKLHGIQTRDKIAMFFEECDCLVFPSFAETFGVAGIEAMAAGLPVIATSCGGPEDYVTESVGYIVPVDDLSALIETMDSFICDRSRFDREKIKKYAANNFSPMKIARELIEVYHGVIVNRMKR